MATSGTTTTDPGSTSRRRLVGSTDVGCNKRLSEKQTIQFNFHEFRRLPTERNKCVTTDVLTCHGFSWRLKLYPGGSSKSTNEEVYISVYIQLIQEDASIEAKTWFRVGSYKSQKSRREFSHNHAYGCSNYLKRSHIMDSSKGYLTSGGTLVVEVDIQIYVHEKKVWYPQIQHNTDFLKLMETSSEWTDTVFLVGEKEERFPAHSCILAIRAPTLFELVRDVNTDDGEVRVPDVDPAVFRALLRFIYASQTPDTDIVSTCGRDLLEAADRFGCKTLKLYVESALVDTDLKVENAADWILYADSHSCALLKEAAMDMFILNQGSVMKSSGWQALKESAALLAELLQHRSCHSPADENDLANMDVASLRNRLEEQGLDIDGTRDMLIRRLREEK